MSAQKIFGLGALGLFWLSRIALGEEAVTFAHYNIENYLEMNRTEGGQAVLGPKPEREKNTLIRIIKEIHPDILGVAEMGPPDQFEEFQKRLKDAGLDFSFSEYVNGPDRDRHLALLSRFTIVERHSEKDLFFDLNGQREPVERGFSGCHDRSKSDIPSESGRRPSEVQVGGSIRGGASAAKRGSPAAPAHRWGVDERSERRPAGLWRS
jgi:hypothetical protein